MEYLVFPFGKYKGVLLNELPSTYIVLSLEQFDLPEELKLEIFYILLGRLKVYTSMRSHLEENGYEAFVSMLHHHLDKYEKK